MFSLFKSSDYSLEENLKITQRGIINSKGTRMVIDVMIEKDLIRTTRLNLQDAPGIHEFSLMPGLPGPNEDESCWEFALMRVCSHESFLQLSSTIMTSGQTRENSRRLSRKIWAGSNSMRAHESRWECIRVSGQTTKQLWSLLALVWPGTDTFSSSVIVYVMEYFSLATQAQAQA